MIKRLLRLGIRLAAMVGIGLAAAKLADLRRQALYGSFAGPQPSTPSLSADSFPPVPSKPQPAAGHGGDGAPPAVPDDPPAVPDAPPAVPDAEVAPLSPAPEPAEPAAPEPAAPEPAAPAAAPRAPRPIRPWVVPDGSSCPASHPVKAKMSSKTYHLPGMSAYDRTKPDRCYLNAEAAEADGLHRASR
ncbi:MAG: sunset domain-containing protein [Acidimicrobiales bacterium]